jgi:WD40 repeat protein
VRIWDVRKANGLVALLDQEDTVGIVDAETPRAPRLSAKAHAGPVNGLTWTDDGAYLVSAGHDGRIRVWDAATGANTLANFGPSIRNSQMGTLTMFVSPVGLTPPGRELLFFPNETEILVMDLHEGSTVTRLRGMGPAVAAVGTRRGGERTVRNRVTCSTCSKHIAPPYRHFSSNPDIMSSRMERSRRRRRFQRYGYGRQQRPRGCLQRAFGRADPGLAPTARRRR